MDSTETTPATTYEIWLKALWTTYRELVEATGALVPNLVSAVLVLCGGWAIAWLSRFVILRVGRSLDHLFEFAKQRTGQSLVELRWPLSRILAYSVYWLVILFFLTVAASVLELPGVVELFRSVLLYLPLVLFAGIALFLVYLASGFVGDLTESSAGRAGFANAAGMGRLVRIVIVALALIIAIGHLGVDTTLLVNIATAIAAMALAGAALAFGIGAAGEVSNIVASRHARRHYRVGQRVRIGDIEGEIVGITRGALLIDTQDGRTLVPARLLSETVSVLLEEDAHNA